MRREHDTLTHLVAGGVGGTVGAVVTCPLEVVKTRLQASSSGFEARAGTSHVIAPRSVWQRLRWPILP